MSKLLVLQLVDNAEYVSGNCYQHQLQDAMSRVATIHVVPLSDIVSGQPLPVGYDRIVSCFKQRTLATHFDSIKNFLAGAPWVLYDQDPWQAYVNDCRYTGLYERLCEKTNLKKIAVTTKWWSNYLVSKGLPATFVRMWVLPRYCDASMQYTDRSKELGFVGTVHPHRQLLFDNMRDVGLNINVWTGNGRDYASYLKMLHNIRIFVRSEDNPITLCDGTQTNVGHGIWIRDIEVAAQGCWSLREEFSAEDRVLYAGSIPIIRTYGSMAEMKAVIADITSMDARERQALIDASVKHIKDTDVWSETATALLETT